MMAYLAPRPFLMAMVILTLATLCLQEQSCADSKKIVFVRTIFKPDPGSAMIDQFKTTLRQRGYQEGENIEYVDILINKPCRDAVKEMLQTIDSHLDSTDLFVTAGWISQPVRTKLSETGVPQLFAPVLKEEALAMLPSLTAEPGANLSGVYLNYPPERILRIARQLLPQIKNYAYVFDSGLSTDLVMKMAFEKLPENEHHGFAVHYLDLAEGTAQVLQQMQTLQIEAFGGIIGAYKNREALDRSGLPMITALLMDIDEEEVAARIRKSNILAGLFDPMNFCGKEAGEMAADILDGRKSIARTIPRPTRQVAFVNMQAAERLKIPVPFALLEAVDIVIK